MSFQSPQALNNLVPIKNHHSKTIVFIDTSLTNWTSLIQKVAVTARVIIIGSEDDGIKEISEILKQSNCWELHIFSSGLPGCIYLGNSELSFNTLNTYSLEMSQWFIKNKSVDLVKLPRIFIHGHNLAVGDVGEEFTAKLNQITGAQISIINNLLGQGIFI